MAVVGGPGVEEEAAGLAMVVVDAGEEARNEDVGVGGGGRLGLEAELAEEAVRSELERCGESLVGGLVSSQPHPLLAGLTNDPGPLLGRLRLLRPQGSAQLLRSLRIAALGLRLKRRRRPAALPSLLAFLASPIPDSLPACAATAAALARLLPDLHLHLVLLPASPHTHSLTIHKATALLAPFPNTSSLTLVPSGPSAPRQARAALTRLRLLRPLPPPPKPSAPSTTHPASPNPPASPSSKPSTDSNTNTSAANSSKPKPSSQTSTSNSSSDHSNSDGNSDSNSNDK